MVHDHYLDHQPKRGAKIISWFLLAIFISFFVGFFFHSALGRPPRLHSLGADAPTENALPTDGTPASSGAGGLAQPLW